MSARACADRLFDAQTQNLTTCIFSPSALFHFSIMHHAFYIQRHELIIWSLLDLEDFFA